MARDEALDHVAVGLWSEIRARRREHARAAVAFMLARHVSKGRGLRESVHERPDAWARYIGFLRGLSSQGAVSGLWRTARPRSSSPSSPRPSAGRGRSWALPDYVRRYDYSRFVIYRFPAAIAVPLVIATGVREAGF
jgi:hypothetical protein